MRRLRSAWTDEAGISVVELLVIVGVLSVIMTMAASSVVTALENQRRQVQRVEALNDAKMVMERLSREARSANPVLSARNDRLRVEVTRDDDRRVTTYRVAPTVDGRPCPCLLQDVERTDTVTGQTSDSSRVLLERLASPDVFVYRRADGATIPSTAADPAVDPAEVNSLELTLVVALDETTGTVRLADRITLRNRIMDEEPE